MAINPPQITSIDAKPTNPPPITSIPPPRDVPIPFGASNPLDEILPNLFLGNLKALDDIPLLRAVGITHILSITPAALPPILPSMGLVHKHLIFSDIRTQNFIPYALESIQYLEDACSGVLPPICSSEEPKVLVHCRMGISRSSSVVIAYLMKHYIPSLPDALAFVQERRPIVNPNDGFCTQISFLGDAGFDASRLPDLKDMPFNPEEKEAPRVAAGCRPPPHIPVHLEGQQ